jgi:microcystin-dependent protein
MSTEPFLGQIKVFGFNFNPRGHALCNGQLLSISQNTALFSLLGTTYGGNGQTTFGLPNLQGRIPVNQGQGPGLPPFIMGEMAGEENHTLITSEMPAHNHTAVANNNAADQTYPSGMVWANVGSGAGFSNVAGNGNIMAAQSLANAGGGQPHNNMSPYLVVNYSIALSGIFPSRN